jgi:hypothetical protein
VIISPSCFCENVPLIVDDYTCPTYKYTVYSTQKNEHIVLIEKVIYPDWLRHFLGYQSLFRAELPIIKSHSMLLDKKLKFFRGFISINYILATLLYIYLIHYNNRNMAWLNLQITNLRTQHLTKSKMYRIKKDCSMLTWASLQPKV